MNESTDASRECGPGDPYRGPIIDAHHHVWDLKRNLYPWLLPSGKVAHRYGDYSAIKKDYLALDFLRDIAGTGVVASVYMEAEWDPTDPFGEVRYIEELSRDYGVPGSMAAQAWLDADDVESQLEKLQGTGIVRSVRHKPGGPSSRAEVEAGGRTLMSNPDWRRGYALLGSYDLHFELQTPWWNLAEACELADSFPETTIVVNHSGVLLDREQETVDGWQRAMSAIAQRPNVVVKASGLCVEGASWTPALNREIVLSLIEMFGSDRVMFGSNFPVDGMFVGYADLVDGYREMTKDLADADKRQFFSGTAERLYSPRPIAGNASRG